MYIIENSDGERVSAHWEADGVASAIKAARDILLDDPELGELTIWNVRGQERSLLRTVTFGPDANWETQIVILEPGQKVEPPAPLPRRISEEDLEAYEPGDPKRIALAERIGEWY